MASETKPFQLIILGVFGFFAVVGVVMFATFRGPESTETEVPVIMWGTIPFELFDVALNAYNAEASVNDQLFVIYREIRPDLFDRELVEALAEGRGPDMVLIPHNGILEHEAKLLELPFESYPERTFKDTFVELGELYLTDTGVLGLPFVADPMVLYWNRDLFSSNGIALPPTTWEEFVSMVEKLTERDQQNNILRSTVALGEFQNVTHAKEILTMLFLQAGDPIVQRDTTGALVTTFGGRFSNAEVPAESVLRFYTEFANPVKPLYSWNRSLPAARDAFLAGDTTMYFGFASEAKELKARNPNLNFDVAMVPQIAGGAVKKTYGNMYAISLLKSTSKASPAFRSAAIMTGQTFLSSLAEATGLPPVRRDMLSAPATNAIAQTLRDSILIADAFLDPNPSATNNIFKNMVENITAGRSSINESITTARNDFNILLQQ